jgi:hypothetical protein
MDRMGFFAKLAMLRRVVARGRATPETQRLLGKRKGIFAGAAAMELAFLASDRVEGRIKSLAQIKVGALVGCPF